MLDLEVSDGQATGAVLDWTLTFVDRAEALFRAQLIIYTGVYFDRVMRPLFEELSPKSPILPALLAPNSRIKLTVVGEAPPKRAVASKEEEQNRQATTPRQFVQDKVAADVSALDFLVREAGDDIYVLACKKEGPTIRVR